MDRTERFYKIEMLIRSRGCVHIDTLLAELEVSRATFKRDLAYLRDRLGAPIEYDALTNGYRFGEEHWRAVKHELPGLWLSEHELHALLTLHQMLEGLDEGELLGRHLAPMFERIHTMLGLDEGAAKDLQRRVKLISTARRRANTAHFEKVCSGVLSGQRLVLDYRKRSGGATPSIEAREVSPQRLVHYRHAWYLDAWCHKNEGLRRFALDAVQAARLLDAKAKRLPLKTVEADMDRGYGIFAGGAEQWAELLFKPEAAAWVAHEEWHPAQQVQAQSDGSLLMRLPYVDPTELLMDLLRHAGQVTVRAPDSLRHAFADRLRAAVDQL
ncbi:helix-turn-helix transcriptional regulator [Inhella gelatinilytica]|uniref:WYL domain-containing protein n=1 Tax=Inhella gelatinilytica TaxID=2795030 RepID=A0A931IUU0_9BURK|nr:WYL domain-containing protein [Inhella gelatinilytica]MBH9551951.1 WYL domain-containing protein [Inhella gelatinilytica]